MEREQPRVGRDRKGQEAKVARPASAEQGWVIGGETRETSYQGREQG